VIDGVELCRVFEREAPDGSVYLIGMLGDAGIAIVKDPTRPGAWRMILSDPAQHTRHSEPAARAIAAPTIDEHGWYGDNSISDDIPDDVMTSQQPSEGC
jgi:hypothetical protein